MKKRNLFAELSEGFEALAEEREGKHPLRTHEVERLPDATVTAGELAALRERLHLSRPVSSNQSAHPGEVLREWLMAGLRRRNRTFCR